MTRLSIVIPVYNSAATVGRTLASLGAIALSARSGIEVIVVDDGSADDSLAIVRRSTALVEGLSWRILTQSNKGPSAARNTALAVAGGEWILFLDADDKLTTDPCPFLVTAVAASCVTFAVEYVGRSGRRVRRVSPPRIGPANNYRLLTAGNPFAVSSLVFRRAALDRPFAEDIRYAEDWEFWLANRRVFAAAARFPRTVLSTIHVHGNNSSSHYRRWGLSRATVARRHLEREADELRPEDQNNMRVQMAVGEIQAGRQPAVRDFLHLPCDWRLWMKLGVYAGAWAVGRQATRYAADDDSAVR
ncbi:glycosyltransferase family 2 protein [Limnoglobus roseus]|uniref:GT2 family glycosyltransferase n=1 Tax=Limnoglobus roseus TaxID=2598579 RepID=A0A5C1AG28_9BACT|nr:glycosyltransferase [Limnoglobus roseus]QEL18379.1 GT2 family glycosyltransferase [Limnoglobus roseus]